jgi:hypothetical protein
MKDRNLVTEFMNEYVAWGGPIVTRKVAYDDCILKGFTAHQADFMAFGRKAVEAPADPAGHLAFLRRIQMAEGLILTVAA